MSTQDKIKEAIALVEEGLQSITSEREWLNFLKFQSLFYQYSYSNAILIYLQNPEATYVKGYKAWNKLGRYVVKGGKGLKILAPCYCKVEVFKEPENKAEYHQMEGEKEVKEYCQVLRLLMFLIFLIPQEAMNIYLYWFGDYLEMVMM